MNFIDTSLRRPVTVIITTLAIIFFGVYVYNQMPMQKRPSPWLPSLPLCQVPMLLSWITM